MKKIIIKTFTYIPKNSIVYYVNKFIFANEYNNGITDGAYNNINDFIIGTSMEDSSDPLYQTHPLFIMKTIDEGILPKDELIIDLNIEFDETKPACSIFDYKNKIRPGWIIISTPMLYNLTEEEIATIKQVYEDEGVWYPENLYSFGGPSRQGWTSLGPAFIAEVNINKLYDSDIVYGYIPFTYPISTNQMSRESICKVVTPTAAEPPGSISLDKTASYLFNNNFPIALAIVWPDDIRNIFVSKTDKEIIFKDNNCRLGIITLRYDGLASARYSMFSI